MANEAVTIEQIEQLLTEARQRDVAEIATLRGEMDELRRSREVIERREAIHGGELSRGEMHGSERRSRVVNIVGNHMRALMLARSIHQDPANIAERMFGDLETANHIRSMAEGNFAAGGALVPTQYAQDVIELLVPNSVVRVSGATLMPLTGGNLSMPKITGGAQAYYQGEAQPARETQIETGMVQLTARDLTAFVLLPNGLLRDTSGRANTYVTNNLRTSIKAKEDITFLRGAPGNGAAPTGLRYLVDQVTNVLSPGAGLSATPTLSEILELTSTRVLESNTSKEKLAWVMSDATLQRYRYAKATTGQYIYRDEMREGLLGGYPFFSTNQLPKNLVIGANTGLSEVFFGDWSQFIIGDTEGFRVDSSTDASVTDALGVSINSFQNNMTVLRAIASHDANVQHAAAFAVSLANIQAATA